MNLYQNSPRILNITLLFSAFRLKIPCLKATFFWRRLIIETNDFINSDQLGATMDLTSATIDHTAIECEQGAQVAVFLPSDKLETLTGNETDFELAQISASGNIAAFEVLYSRYHRRTYSLCMRMTNSVTEAEDLTQEVFIQLYRKIGSFRGASAFSTWLHRLTVNQVLMHFRKRSVKSEKTSDDGEMPDQVVTGTENPNKMPIVDRIALNKAISELPNGYRSVFVLHDIEGYEHEEVARIMGISVARRNRSCTKRV